MQSAIDLQAYQQITPRFSYNVFELLGGGSYGRVYKGYDNEARKIIAVKHIPLKILRQIRNIFEREIQILQRLRHPNIIEYYGSHGGINHPDGIFLFFELCEKGTLSESIIKKKPTEAQSLSIFKQLVEGMTYVNSQQIFHRDLKPDNLLLNADNQLKIADFGTAIQFQLQEGKDRTYRRCTPVYAAPEVYLLEVYDRFGRKYTEKCDIFSAGYILYELLTGEQLTQGISTEAQLSSFLRNIANGGMNIEHPALSERWKALLKRMLSFSPEQRPTFAFIKNLLNSFEEVSNSPPVDRVCDEAQRQYSQNMVELVKKTLQNQQRKNNYYINILKIFEAKKNVVSWVFPRPGKLVLIYYSLMFYVKQAEDRLNFLNDPLKLYIAGHELETVFVRMVSNDKAELLKFIEQKANRLNKAVQQVKSLLNRQIIPEIESINNLQEGNPQKMFLMLFRTISNIGNYRRGEFSVTNEYIKSITQCLHYLYQTNADLQVLSQDDLKMYLVVANVAYLQTIVGDLQRQNLRWPLCYRQIQDLNKRALIREIQERRVGQ